MLRTVLLPFKSFLNSGGEEIEENFDGVFPVRVQPSAFFLIQTSVALFALALLDDVLTDLAGVRDDLLLVDVLLVDGVGSGRELPDKEVVQVVALDVASDAFAQFGVVFGQVALVLPGLVLDPLLRVFGLDALERGALGQVTGIVVVKTQPLSGREGDDPHVHLGHVL